MPHTAANCTPPATHPAHHPRSTYSPEARLPRHLPWRSVGVGLGEINVDTVNSPEARESASSLLQRRYDWRGYGSATLPDAHAPARCTLVASSGTQVLGTLTVALDGMTALNCETLFGPEVAALRATAARVCEFTRLAVEVDAARSPQVLTALFLAAYVVAHRVGGRDTLLVEVNPRHVRFYRRHFGAQPLAEVRHHPGVDAPAVLLSLALAPLRELARLAECEGRAAEPGLSGVAGAALARSAPEWRN